MHADRPPFLFVAIWGLLAAAMMLGQFQMASHGMTLASLIDIQDPDIVQLAALD
ncbi:hypothetical protein [Methylobacterium nigriterrae]|uniref:hypothetical protein n=1 Tax=Methylobacterium nigriterrae TaxID=3127512 RepID=UPI0030135CDA